MEKADPDASVAMGAGSAASVGSSTEARGVALHPQRAVGSDLSVGREGLEHRVLAAAEQTLPMKPAPVQPAAEDERSRTPSLTTRNTPGSTSSVDMPKSNSSVVIGEGDSVTAAGKTSSSCGVVRPPASRKPPNSATMAAAATSLRGRRGQDVYPENDATEPITQNAWTFEEE